MRLEKSRGTPNIPGLALFIEYAVPSSDISEFVVSG
jgi:hypothetical protein